MIKLDNCVHGNLYLLDSRNLNMGIFNKETKGFIGIRTKFGFRFLFTEYHREASTDFGTAKPLELIEETPFGQDKIQERITSTVTEEMIAQGLNHLSVGQTVSVDNKEIRNYLEEKEEEWREEIEKREEKLRAELKRRYHERTNNN